MSAKQSTKKFELVYSSSKKPSTRHLDDRCWKGVDYRQATADEMKSIAVCKHCARRAEQDEAKREQIPARKQQATAEKVLVAA